MEVRGVGELATAATTTTSIAAACYRCYYRSVPTEITGGGTMGSLAKKEVGRRVWSWRSPTITAAVGCCRLQAAAALLLRAICDRGGWAWEKRREVRGWKSHGTFDHIPERTLPSAGPLFHPLFNQKESTRFQVSLHLSKPYSPSNFFQSMASGSSSGRAGSGSRSFDFGSDDVLCSYDDLVNTEAANGKRSEPSGKDLHESRPGRASQSAYHQQEAYDKTDVINAVEKCMKKYADNMFSFLEGISRRLSQLEVYCYNLEKSIGDFRSDLSQEQNEADMKFKSLEKHLQEVHRSIQILRDKQELAETQKELVKLQLGQKDSPDGVSNSALEQKKKDDPSDAENKQLALALTQVVAPQPPPQPRITEPNQHYSPALLPTSSALNMQQPPYAAQGSSFYPQQNQLPSQPSHPPQPQQVPPPELRYVQQAPQQDLHLPPQQQQQQQQLPVSVGQSQAPPFSQYQSQWPQQASQPFPQPTSQPPQQSPPPASFPTQSPPTYPPPYQTSQPLKSSPETYQGSMPPPVGYSSVPLVGGNHQEPAPYGYGSPANAMQQSLPPAPSRVQPQPQLQTGQGSSGPQVGKSSYMVSPPYPPQPSGQGYGIYPSDGGRPSQSQTLYLGNYPPAGMPPPPPPPQSQQPSLGSLGAYQHSAPPPIRSGHPYGELMDKAVSMGYPREQVAGAIYRMEESGQPVDFNALLDLLNGSASGGARRGWSG